MTRAEVMQIEDAIKERDGAQWRDTQRGDQVRTPKIITFEPEIRLEHDGRPENVFELRQGLANYLRRIAAYLEA